MRRTEHGSGTLMVLAVVMLFTAGVVAAVLWISVIAAKHRTAAAADLAALSAAEALQSNARQRPSDRADLRRPEVGGSEAELGFSARPGAPTLGSPADEPLRDDGGACQTAASIANAHNTDLEQCSIDVETEVVVVVTSVQLDLGALGSPVIRAAARGGPIGAAEAPS
ncbi:hypothetical protein [Kribbella deserti]|uniref:Flp pilus-assembly TadG-like N-terminal domain-containing protein n=1 Tax=Kribbella deserti TaxID=1926257 RepID=A0ABV6QSL6_9ACTN